MALPSGWKTPIIGQAEAYVRQQLMAGGIDSSHDWWHVERVRTLALSLAAEEGLPAEDLETVELGALLHDIGDWKYSGSEKAGPAAARAFLQENGYGEAGTSAVLEVVEGVGFKDELAGGRGGGAQECSPALRVVQDADRLDAIGAIGIARCLTFGGAFKRVLHDPTLAARPELTKEKYMKGGQEQTTINHFYEKLLKLKGLMKSEAGRRRAEQRHAYMQEFLEQFFGEWEGTR